MGHSAHPYDLFVQHMVEHLDGIAVKPEHKKTIQSEVVGRIREQRASREHFQLLIEGYNHRVPKEPIQIGVREHKSEMRKLIMGLPKEHPFFGIVALELKKYQAVKQRAPR